MQDKRNLQDEWAPFFVVSRNYQAGGLGAKLREAGRFIYSREARRNLMRLILAFEPDIAHLHNIYHQLTPSIIWELHKRNIPTVLTLHDYKLACPSYQFLDRNGKICTRCAGGSIRPVLAGKCGKGGRAVGALLFAEAAFHHWAGSYRRMISAFIAPSRFMKERIVEAHAAPEEKIHYIPNFVDCSAYDAVYDDAGYFLYAGRLACSKGVVTLAKAAAGIPGCRLKIAGTGDEADKIENYCRESDGRIEMLGYCEQVRLRELMQKARAIIVPSEWYENCPMVVLEAFACGKPVIASNIGGLPELVLPGETGLLFKPGDVDDLAAKMEHYLDSTESAKKMGANARKRAETIYSSDNHYRAIMNLYHQILHWDAFILKS